MKILTTSANAQTLSFIPREYPASIKMTLRDTSTNTTETVDTLTLTKTNDKASISTSFSVAGSALVEGRFYDLTIIKGTGALWNSLQTQWQLATANWGAVISSESVIYLDKIFCTDQTIDQSDNSYYSINNGEYTQTTSYPNDDYIIIN